MEKLNLNSKLLSALKKAKLWSFSAILELSDFDLERITELSKIEVKELKTVIAHYVMSRGYTTAKHLLMEKQQRISLGCSILDSALQGGLLLQGITEITGISSSGKTQLALQICLSIQKTSKMDGVLGGSVYICTEDPFPNKRLKQLIESRKRLGLLEDVNYENNIYIEHIAEWDHLWLCITSRLPKLLAQGKIKLVVIDSVAALFRYEEITLLQKVDRLCSLAAYLHKLSLDYHNGIICINQVTGAVCDTNSLKQNIPALGISWANFITCRLMLCRTNHVHSTSLYNNKPVPIVLRNIEVIFAPHLPKLVIPFIVDIAGVKGVR